MRSQASNPFSKKGIVTKSTLKAGCANKQAKKKSVAPAKKVKSILKSIKGLKKGSTKNDTSDEKDDGESTSGDNTTTSSSDIIKIVSPKTVSRGDSPWKKSKKLPKEKKIPPKKIIEANVKKVAPKKAPKAIKKAKAAIKCNKKKSENDDNIKYKINIDAIKKYTSKFSKAKTLIKKGNVSQKKKGLILSKEERSDKKKTRDEGSSMDGSSETEDEKKITAPKTSKISDDTTEDDSVGDSMETNFNSEISISDNSSNTPSQDSHPDIPKAENERPPKFFTSARFSRTVDIDAKCFKSYKGNLSVSERFLSMKSDENSKDKSSTSTLTSQGSDIDVYTFTEKVDSPKNILSDFRSPANKNVGRVRPIARVKGTVIDRKNESEKKKYSPHRPIEEVVKQLKANKRSEDLVLTQNQPSLPSSKSDPKLVDKHVEDKPLVSKSYKMVARKSSVTGKPFSLMKFDNDSADSKTGSTSSSATSKKQMGKSKKVTRNNDVKKTKSKTLRYVSSEESTNTSNDDNDTKESSESESPTQKKIKSKKYRRITDSVKKNTSKELRDLSKDSLIDLKHDDDSSSGSKPNKRRLKLMSMWTGPKKHRMASLNALAKVHCLYENESRSHMELGLLKTVERQPIATTSKPLPVKKKRAKPKDFDKSDSASESEYENGKMKMADSSESSDDSPPQRSLRGVPGIRSAGKYWDPKSSTSSSEDSEIETKQAPIPENKKSTVSTTKSDTTKQSAKMKKTAGVPVKKKRNRNEVVMDLKDMVVHKRMASLNATAILAASYEKRSPKSSRDDTTSDSCSDEYFTQKPKNLVNSGVKSEVKNEDNKKECDDSTMADRKQKVEVIVNQDTDVTITGVYSTHHHEGFCTVSGMQYRISSTSHTQTTATANCEKESGCSREEGPRYTPLSALSSMQPPAEQAHTHPQPECEAPNHQ